MKTSGDFLKSGTHEEFSSVLKLYSDAIRIKVSQKKKKDGESLEVLDKWCQEELGKLARARSPPHITREELVRLMKWKLSRGKFRPRLVELAGSNSDEIVKEATTKGIQLALKNKVEDAIDALVVLKGVGPATASGILAACAPEKCCFFADEVALAIPTLSTLKYSAAEYQLLNTTMVECTKRLNKEKDDEEDVWTPHMVELAVWTYCLLLQNEPELLSDLKKGPEDSHTTSKKRKFGKE